MSKDLFRLAALTAVLLAGSCAAPATGGVAARARMIESATTARSVRSRVIIVGSSLARYASIAASVAFDLRSSKTILSYVSMFVCHV